MNHITPISERAASGGAANLPWGFLVMQVILLVASIAKDP